MTIHKVLSIAGFDSSGGAGLQADLKTFSAFGCYGMTVLTALPVQNTTGVKACYDIPTQAILDQLIAIFEDIPPDAIKIGMLFNSEIISIVSDFLKTKATKIPIVLDPVMVAKSGDSLLLPQAIKTLKNKLIPQSLIVTPNLYEAKALTGTLATSREEMEKVAEDILKMGPTSVLLKGGHLKGKESPDFYLHSDGTREWLTVPRIRTNNLHGAGCTLSAAIASCLSLGLNLYESCKISKDYMTKSLEASRLRSVGQGIGPVHHFYHLWPALEKI